jgi:glycine hydroxymethyltransferase
MGKDEMAAVANWIDQAVTAATAEDEDTLARIRAEVADLCAAFPAPGIVV